MLRDAYETDLSELEQEFELEMDDLELDEGEAADEEFEESDEFEYEGDLGEELEAGDEEGSDYAERFYELSQMEFESESDVDREMEGLLDEMEREYFFGGVGKFLKKGAKGLIKKGLDYAKKNIPAIKALQSMTPLLRGNLKGLLKSFGGPLLKKALAATPQGAAALAAMKVLGFEATEDSEVDREVWDNYVAVCREAYEHLAENLNENANHPLEAAKLASNAFQAGLKRTRATARARSRPGMGARRGGRPGSPRRRRVIYLGPNEYVVIRRR